ncbi:ESX secretion-associated protein EspG [Actinophytocola sp. NPDC049390]|uniref:ESX secretion-associated protein EspG n=1 Tax=Actinophytocola sp. NPDC049390 TaxID=3363894 RepID=UPI003787E2D0
MRTAPIELPVSALTALLEWEGAGEPHQVLRPEVVWREPGEQAALIRATLDALAAAGVMTAPGQVDRDLRDLLPLLTTPTVEYSGWFTADGRTKGVLAAAGALDAVVAVRDGDRVRITPVPPDRLTDALITELPDVRAGRGSSFVVTAADIDDLRAPSDVSERRVPEHVARMVELAHQAVRDGGELYAVSRDALGRCVTRGPVWYADTDDGRYLNYTLGAGDALRIVVAPGTPSSLVEALASVRAPVGRQAGRTAR